MKATIENPVQCFADESKKLEQLSEFNEILKDIFDFKNEEQLRKGFKSRTFEYFIFGFGGSHMWVKQIIRGEVKQQVLFVEF
jgi:Golgi nucleoside diphosphatase